MQAVTGVVYDWVNTPAVKTLQIGGEIGADLVRCRAALTGAEFVVLVNISIFQSQQFFFWLGQTSSGHAPSANRGAYQIDGLITARQPMTE
jgi:hypothetical protein